MGRVKAKLIASACVVMAVCLWSFLGSPERLEEDEEEVLRLDALPQRDCATTEPSDRGHAGDDGGEDVSRNKVCSFATRYKHVNKVCRKTPASVMEGRHKTYQYIFSLTVDHKHKLLYCRIAKTGSASVVDLMRNVSLLAGDKLMQRIKFRNYAESLRDGTRTEVQYILRAHVEEAAEAFKDYKKFIVVRHPLQRLVSAFYHACVDYPRADCLGITNFTEFVSRLVLDESRQANMHWRSYQDSCHPCLMKYDYILRLESEEVDMAELRRVAGLHPSLSLNHHHFNPKHTRAESEDVMDDVISDVSERDRPDGEAGTYGDIATKYDTFLRQFQEKQPQLFEDFLSNSIFALDMAMFGYSWTDNKSQCHVGSDQCC